MIMHIYIISMQQSTAACENAYGQLLRIDVYIVALNKIIFQPPAHSIEQFPTGRREGEGETVCGGRKNPATASHC